MPNTINQNRIRQIIFIAFLLALGILLFIELYTFLPALLGAITLYILMHRWMFYLTEKRKWRKGWTAALLTLAITTLNRCSSSPTNFFNAAMSSDECCMA